MEIVRWDNSTHFVIRDNISELTLQDGTISPNPPCRTGQLTLQDGAISPNPPCKTGQYLGACRRRVPREALQRYERNLNIQPPPSTPSRKSPPGLTVPTLRSFAVGTAVWTALQTANYSYGLHSYGTAVWTGLQTWKEGCTLGHHRR